MEKKWIKLQEVIETISDEVGKQYRWFIIGLDAQGIIDEHVTVKDIHKKIRLENLGYYEISWDFLKKICSRLSAVVNFHLIGAKSKEAFFRERAKLDQNMHDWTGFTCELEFFIEDGEIWEINGTDTFLVKRLNKYFSPRPIYLL